MHFVVNKYWIKNNVVSAYNELHFVLLKLIASQVRNGRVFLSGTKTHVFPISIRVKAYYSSYTLKTRDAVASPSKKCAGYVTKDVVVFDKVGIDRSHQICEFLRYIKEPTTTF